MWEHTSDSTECATRRTIQLDRTAVVQRPQGIQRFHTGKQQQHLEQYLRTLKGAGHTKAGPVADHQRDTASMGLAAAVRGQLERELLPHRTVEAHRRVRVCCRTGMEWFAGLDLPSWPVPLWPCTVLGCAQHTKEAPPLLLPRLCSSFSSGSTCKRSTAQPQ